MGVMSFVFLLGLALCFHCMGDFLAQTSWMATQKSKELKPLLFHVLTYSGFMLGFVVVCESLVWVPVSGDVWAAWLGLNLGLHFITDFFSSKLARRATEAKKTNIFWVVVGLDQLAHQLCLLISLAYILR